MESFNHLENKIIRMEEKIDNIKTNIDNFHSTNKEEHQEIKKLLESKANVWVEDAIKWLIYLVVGILVTALVALVIKK